MNAMNHSARTNNRGFTLIEVMIVVVVIGVLSAIAYPSYTAYVLRSHRAEAKPDRSPTLPVPKVKRGLRAWRRA